MPLMILDKTNVVLLSVSLTMVGWLSGCHRLPLDTHGTVATDQKNPRQESAAVRNATDNDELDELDELDNLDSNTPDNSPDLAEAAPWSERSFAGNTRYTIETTVDGETIKGETNGQASVLYRQTTVDLIDTAKVSWAWKIKQVYAGADEKTRAGDDFPARFYVVVQTGALPWQTKTINYIWASREPAQTHWLNPFTEDALMLVLDSGMDNAGQWITHQRDVIDDFKRYWQLEVTELSGYAFMVDGDNTGSQGVAWLRNLQFSPR